MNMLERNPTAETIKRELDEQTFAALLKYARCILKIHYLGLVDAMNGTSDLAADGETSG